MFTSLCSGGHAVAGVSGSVALECLWFSFYLNPRSGRRGSHDENQTMETAQNKPLTPHEELSPI